MICEHLAGLEKALAEKGFKEVYRGQPWSKNCREWVYFDCHLDLASIRDKHKLDSCVTDHVHRGTHDGAEAGFYCSTHQDGVMGAHEAYQPDLPTFRG